MYSIVHIVVSKKVISYGLLSKWQRTLYILGCFGSGAILQKIEHKKSRAFCRVENTEKVP